MQKAYCIAPILLTKSKILKLSLYKRKTSLETIAFFSEWCFKKRWTLELPQNLIQI